MGFYLSALRRTLRSSPTTETGEQSQRPESIACIVLPSRLCEALFHEDYREGYRPGFDRSAVASLECQSEGPDRPWCAEGQPCYSTVRGCLQ